MRRRLRGRRETEHREAVRRCGVPLLPRPREIAQHSAFEPGFRREFVDGQRCRTVMMTTWFVAGGAAGVKTLNPFGGRNCAEVEFLESGHGNGGDVSQVSDGGLEESAAIKEGRA